MICLGINPIEYVQEPLLLSCVMLHLGILCDVMDKKLLTIKISEESKSLKNKVIVWFGQLSKGIINILKNARTGIKVFQEIESREKYKQLSLQIWVRYY